MFDELLALVGFLVSYSYRVMISRQYDVMNKYNMALAVLTFECALLDYNYQSVKTDSKLKWRLKPSLEIYYIIVV